MLLAITLAAPARGAEVPEFVAHGYDLNYHCGFHVFDDFTTPTKLALRVLSAPTPGRKGTVDYQWERIAPQIYVISWTEADGGTVVHVDDFAQRISRSYYTPAGKGIVRSTAKIPRS